MAVTFASLSVADRAFAAADKPIILGKNWMRTDGILTRWNQTGDWADPDESDADGDPLYGRDDQSYRRTYPDASQTLWYYLIDLGAADGILNAASILHHVNLSGVTVTLQVADNATYATNLRDLASITPSDSTRIVMLDLDGDAVGVEQEYSSVRYARLKFAKATGFIPSFGELILSQRTQLPYKSDLPYDPNNLRTRKEIFESDSGVMSSYTFWKKRKIMQLILNQDLAAYISDIETLWEDYLDGGRYPYLFIENPATSPTEAYWMEEQDPELSGPYSGPVRREFRFLSIERGPHFYKIEGA